MARPFRMGAVAYAPKVVTIWEGFKEYFRRHDFEFDYILYSNYERQVEAQFDGGVDLAWNSPLAWVRADRMARTRNLEARALAMRDSDRDLTSVLVVRSNSSVEGESNLTALSGQVIGFGAVDSPQANLIPRDYLRRRGLFPNRDYTARRFDELSGKHGDHIGGERDAAVALMKGEIDAAWMIDSNYLAFSREGILPAGVTRIVARSGNYDHCNFTMISGLSSVTDEMAVHFTELLLAMRWQDSQVRPLLELEGLKEWFPGRTSGYELLIRSVDDEKFYDAEGNILVADYRY